MEERGTVKERRQRKQATETWEHIERLLIEECGLRSDEGLAHQRQNCINAILRVMSSER